MLLPVLTTDTGEMALVPGGPFLQGADKKQVTVPPFYIDRTEVTNEAYRNSARPRIVRFPKVSRQTGPKYPVVNVTAADAIAFAKWAGKRLPQAVEWEKAARGTEGKTWPWGDANDPKRANVADNPKLTKHELMEAETMPEGASPYNALHMAGNVLEYVADDITPSTDAVQHFSQILKPPPALNEPWYSVKGGSYRSAAAIRSTLGVVIGAGSIPCARYRFPLRERSSEVSSPTTERFVLRYRMY